MVMIMQIIKHVPDKLGCKIYSVPMLITMPICLGSQSMGISSHLEDDGVFIVRHLLFTDGLREERK